MVKTDESGNEHKDILETDYELYMLESSIVPESQLPFEHIHLYSTSLCNQNCTCCYEVFDAEKEEPPVEEFDNFLSDYRGKNIILSGREPTMREDLDEVVKVINRRNGATLQTNGLKLADYDYCRKLKEAGVRKLQFQFYGFSDEVYEKMVGMKVLDAKLKGIENCIKLDIPISLSSIIAPGVNEQEFPKILDYVLERREHIFNWSIRSMAPVGHHISRDQLYISDLLKVVCKEFKIDRQEVMNEFNFFTEAYKRFKQGLVIPRPCSLTFHLGFNPDGSYYPLGRKMAGSNNLLMLPIKALRAYGLGFFLQYFIMNKIKYKAPKIKNVLRISLRSWPNVQNIDLQQMRKCVTGYYRNGKIGPFCVTNVMESNQPEKELPPPNVT
jgi:MoaA/NifB/PqqE/SkfB family radical SAM enzyme